MTVPQAVMEVVMANRVSQSYGLQSSYAGLQAWQVIYKENIWIYGSY